MDTRRENTADEGTLSLREGEKEPIPNRRRPTRRTQDLLRSCRRSAFESPQNACKSAPFPERRTAGTGASVRRVSDDADVLSDCRDQKDLQMWAFLEAAEGIRTLDLLHGKQDVCFRFGRRYSLQTQRFSCVDVVLRFPGFQREFTGVWVVNG
jgi:hypothetical protein